MKNLVWLLIAGMISAALANADAQTALQAARERYPTTQVRDAVPTALPGVYEFDMGGETVYGDITARYLLFGKLFDMQSPTVTDAYRLIADVAIELQPGIAGEVIVFSDPLCAYCATFEQRIKAGELDDYRISMVLVPLQPGSEKLSAGVLCKANPAQAWRDLMYHGNIPASCVTDKLEQHILAAERAGINATPSFLVPNGELMVGLPESAQLAVWIAQGQL